LTVAFVAAKHEVGFLPMAWAAPAYSRRRVDQAGATYADPASSAEDRELARAVINNWRSSHSFPLNTIQVNLRRAAASYERDPTVAQRIKRLPSIRHKLERFPGMQLSRMQDLGGCRAVVSSVDGVEQVANYYRNESRMKHRLVREDPYIANPKPSGYRGVHLVYSYFSDRSSTWNGLKIEVQIRSRLQHAWATAVETVGTFTQQALKSSLGEEHWLRFFALMSSWLAMREGTATVPETPDDPTALARELRRYARRLDVVERLAAYGQALQYAEQHMGTMRGAHTFLLELNIPEKTLLARTYADQLVAAEEYSAIERAIESDPGKDAVLVSVESLATLRRAYPNYFLDTSVFLESVREAIAT
jgi:ppGpp synthetase/RelA/SpoT-type nucleotidyltranferase